MIVHGYSDLMAKCIEENIDEIKDSLSIIDHCTEIYHRALAEGEHDIANNTIDCIKNMKKDIIKLKVDNDWLKSQIPRAQDSRTLPG